MRYTDNYGNLYYCKSITNEEDEGIEILLEYNRTNDEVRIRITLSSVLADICISE